ncbi:hypothetical protein V5R04_14995 [Jonesiaceae bacterium BS-20]|uniref:DUF4854 domain-containing protein n=1 Tax=Jonesiaceae bacterium BS-20 TaxID=3120821 RepID=A0AAU7DW35_9MICO
MQKSTLGFRSNTIKNALIATLAAAALTVGLAACSADDNKPNITAKPSTSESQTPDASSEPEATETAAPEETVAPESTDTGDYDAEAQAELLEKYADLERASFDAVREMYPDLYSEMAVETGDAGAIAFTFTYAEQMDVSASKASFDAQLPQMTTQINDEVFPLMRDFGLEGDLAITYQYFAPDNVLIWEYTFESLDQ